MGWQPNIGSGGGTAAMPQHRVPCCLTLSAWFQLLSIRFKSNSPIEITRMRTELLSAIGGCQVLKGTSSILVTTRYWSPGGPSYGYRAVMKVFARWWFKTGVFIWKSRREAATPQATVWHDLWLRLMYVSRHHQIWNSKFCKQYLLYRAIPLFYQDACD